MLKPKQTFWFGRGSDPRSASKPLPPFSKSTPCSVWGMADRILCVKEFHLLVECQIFLFSISQNCKFHFERILFVLEKTFKVILLNIFSCFQSFMLVEHYASRAINEIKTSWCFFACCNKKFHKKIEIQAYSTAIVK